mgnify:CR=1 FL=1
MRQGTYTTYPALRRAYASAEALGMVINKDRSTVKRKLNKTGFTAREKSLIFDDLTRRGIDTNDIFEG